jgi:mannose-6-phosphate isomerase
MNRGLDRKIALDCFDFKDQVGGRAIAAGRKQPRSFLQLAGVTAEHLLSYQDTPDFAVNRYRLRGGMHQLSGGPAVYVVTDGAGKIQRSGYSRPVHRGDYFFLPACVTDLSLATDSSLEVIECLPPQGA